MSLDQFQILKKLGKQITTLNCIQSFLTEEQAGNYFASLPILKLKLESGTGA